LDQANILLSCQKSEIKTLLLHGVDEIAPKLYGDAFVVYIGHHGDITAHRADVILPGLTYVEKTARYVNTEGRVQEAIAAIAAPGIAKEDWKIFKALSLKLGLDLPYNTRADVLKGIATDYPHLDKIGERHVTEWISYKSPNSESLSTHEFDVPVANYYMNDTISRHSIIMADCARKVGEIYHAVK
jgi:NADH-quinone oxidoreductase subunit G